MARGGRRCPDDCRRFAVHRRRHTIVPLVDSSRRVRAEASGKKVCSRGARPMVMDRAATSNIDVRWSDKSWSRSWLRSRSLSGDDCSADYLIVVGHYPIFTVGSEEPLACLHTKLDPMLRQYDATIYIAGSWRRSPSSVGRLELARFQVTSTRSTISKTTPLTAAPPKCAT